MPGERILIVDDESSMLMTLAANLELEGYQVTGAASAAEALQLMERSKFDLLISDIRMPGMNGVELHRRVRELHPDTPVLLMTAFALEGLVDAALQEGVFTVLSKPFDVEHLIRAAAAALKRPFVLVVDDDVPVAERTAAALNDAGVRARAAFDGESAVAAVREKEIDVCVVDMVMSGEGGPGIIRRILELDPTIICVAVSGYDVPHLFREVAPRVYTFMRKPVAPRALAQTIARARGTRRNR